MTSTVTANKRLAMRSEPVGMKAIMSQNWRDLLFLHWSYDPKEIQKTLPKGLHVDTFDGRAFIGINPLFLNDVKLQFFFPLPAIPNSLEVNVRTYVFDDNGNPGVWFYSLDTNSLMGSQMAKSFFHLPYFFAEMEAIKNSTIKFSSQRSEQSEISQFEYRPEGGQFVAEPDSLDFFLIERYALFVEKSNGELAMGRVHHLPYPLYKAHVEKWDDKLIKIDGLNPPHRAPEVIHFSLGVDVDIYPLEEV